MFALPNHAKLRPHKHSVTSGRIRQSPLAAARTTRFEHLEDRRMLAAGDIEWIREFSDVESGAFPDVAVAAGNLYVTGPVQGTMSGLYPIGISDGFLRAYDSSGAELWTSRFGATLVVTPRALTVDASGIYVVGQGNLPGPLSLGGGHNFIIKYDFSGNQLWSENVGSSFSAEVAVDVTADATGIYTLCESQIFGTAVIYKHDSNGNHTATRNLGFGNFFSISTHSSGIYVVGEYDDGLGDTEAVVLHLEDVNGSGHLFPVSPGMASAYGVATSDIGVFVSGRTSFDAALPGQTTGGATDAFLRLYDFGGSDVWTRQFGGSQADRGYDVAVDDSAVYVGGTILGVFDGSGFPPPDVFARKFDLQGHEVWSTTLATAEREDAQSLAVDGNGVYLTGHGIGGVPGPDGGSGELFVAKLEPGEVFNVAIDVKPLSEQNTINLSSQGAITVAILSTSLAAGDSIDFDVTQVDASTVIFAEAFAFRSALQDVDNDGDLDLVLHFRTQETNLDEVYAQLVEDDVNADGMLDLSHQLAEASLFGKTLTGDALNTSDELNLFLSGRQLRDLLDALFGG